MRYNGKFKGRCFCWETYLQGDELKAIIAELDRDFMKYCYIIHDKDLQEDGTEKKLHVHFMLDYGAPTTYKHIVSCYGHLASNEYIEPVLKADQYYKYLYHDPCIESSKGKYFYGPDAVICKNGFDPADLRSYSETEKCLLFDGIMAIANKEKIYELAGMYEYLSVNNRDLYQFAINNTILLRGYMDSHRHRNKNLDPKK